MEEILNNFIKLIPDYYFDDFDYLYNAIRNSITNGQRLFLDEDGYYKFPDFKIKHKNQIVEIIFKYSCKYTHNYGRIEKLKKLL